MTTDEPLILVVSGADTGRGPMTANLLRLALAETPGAHWRVESAGVVGHDGDPAEPEARDAMMILGGDINEHAARSLTDDLIATATLLVAVERGIVNVIRMRHPAAVAHTVTLGDLAQQHRDIPDPFRMQVGAWVTYGREIESMIAAGRDRLLARVLGDTSDTPAPADTLATPAPAPAATTADSAVAVADAASVPVPLLRCQQLLDVLTTMPDVIDWQQWRTHMVTALRDVGAAPAPPGDMTTAYVALLAATIETRAARPDTTAQQWLQTAVGRLQGRVTAHEIQALSASLTDWQADEQPH